MSLRRALVIAPLAVLVAVLAHSLAFSDGHELGGSHGPDILAVAIGGPLLLAIAAFVWLVARARNTEHGARILWAALPAGGRLAATAAALGVGGFAAFAAIEASEGRFPLGSLGSVFCLGLVAFVAAAVTRIVARWLAAVGAAVAARLQTPLPLGLPTTSLVAAVPAAARSADPRDANWGRAPPAFE